MEMKIERVEIGVLKTTGEYFMRYSGWYTQKDIELFIQSLNKLRKFRQLIKELVGDIEKLPEFRTTDFPSTADNMYATLKSILDDTDGINVMETSDFFTLDMPEIEREF